MRFDVLFSAGGSRPWAPRAERFTGQVAAATEPDVDLDIVAQSVRLIVDGMPTATSRASNPWLQRR